VIRLSLVLLAACGAPPPEPTWDPSAPLPDASLYHLEVELVDQRGEAVGLDVHRGHPTIVSMFYASCPTACPMLIGDVKEVEQRLDPAVRADSRVLLVSLDPDRDDPEALSGVVRTHDLDGDRWTLARAELDGVRLVAAALDVRFRALADGEMSHSTVLIALDRDGVPVATLNGLRQDPTPLIEALSAP
jgi:protein SCO1/2